MSKSRITFYNGPHDGRVEPVVPDLGKHYYSPISGSMYHYYKMNDDGDYIYQGEVSLAEGV